MKLQNKLREVITDYTKIFYVILTGQPYDESDTYWIGGDITGVCGIGDYFVNLSDMVLVVDNNVSGDDFSDWYWEFVGEYEKGTKQYINLRSYLMIKGYKLK
jgi:hypothetical protein